MQPHGTEQELVCAAPKARNMIARASAERSEARRLWKQKQSDSSPARA